MDTGRIVAYSTRLGMLSDQEERLEAVAAVHQVALDTHEAIAQNAALADVVIAGAVEPLDRTAIAGLPHCIGIVRRGVGVDNVDLKAASDHGIVVAYVPDASVEEVSDHALALLLTLARRIEILDRGIRSGMWAVDQAGFARSREPIPRLSSATLGIIGFGRIGQALARKAHGIVGRTKVFDPYRQLSAQLTSGVEMVNFDELVQSADLISLHAPSTPETYHLINAAALGQMRPGVILVNTARGSLIDESALVEALRSGRPSGVGLDVVEQEPMGSDHPLLGFPNVLVTGHSAASSLVASAELRRRSVDAALAILRDTLPDSVANEEVLDSPRLRLRLRHGGIA
jgi:D-3-phosphoglycerate dehydrogenase / 2-oxoglutarate reductase